MVLGIACLCRGAFGQGDARSYVPGPAARFSQIIGRPTDRTATLSVLSADAIEVYVEHGSVSGQYTHKSPIAKLDAGVPRELELGGLKADAKCFYRLRSKQAGATEFASGEEYAFHTARGPGSAFVFSLQGDSHPERMGKMYDPDLYTVTMRNVAAESPDFYLTLGDDFSVERLISRKSGSQQAVDAIYSHQRGFLGIIGRGSPLFLVNGNHEEAAKCLLDGTPNNIAVYAGKARTKFYPLPAPDSFYSGDADPVEHIGLLRDYYAWTWGDALFVVIDPYWHSDVPVDGEVGGKKQDEKGEKGGGKRGRDMWGITLGDKQHAWLEHTLRGSNARFKFIFCHHVLGTGRGGIEMASRFEWGGADNRGVDRFFQNRPGWQLPIHALLKETGVSIVFQGHDHLYARQELDGVVYQSVPNPADSTFQAFNRESYRSGDIFPNAGHVRVSVSPTVAKVEYVASRRESDEKDGTKNGAIIHAYEVRPRGANSGASKIPATGPAK
jgi:hypothetical protein